MDFQNTQEPTHDPWGSDISEEETDDEATEEEIDHDATEEETDDEETEEESEEECEEESEEKGNEEDSQCSRPPTSPIIRATMRRAIRGDKPVGDLDGLEIRFWLQKNRSLFPELSREDTLIFICKYLDLNTEISVESLEEQLVKAPKLLRTVLEKVHFANRGTDVQLELAHRIWFFSWNNIELVQMLASVK